MKAILILTGLFIFSFVGNAQKPVNERSNEKTKRLLIYLSGLHEREQEKLIPGVMGLRYEAREDAAGAEEIFKHTGKWVGLIGHEYCESYGNRQVNSADEAVIWEEKNPEFIEFAKEGGIVRILTHYPNPTHEKYSGLRDSSANIDAILTGGTPERKRWLALLDEVANGLHDLDKHGIAAIFGPLHEMNGWWFWWCAEMDNMNAEKFRELWIDQYNYLTYEKECNNILWLWAQGGNPDLNLDLYPGDAYVDIVGLDVYKPSLEAIADKYQMLQTLGKPFMIAEFGPRGKKKEFDYLNLLEEINTYCPNTFAIMSWHSIDFTPVNNPNGIEYMNHPMVLTREKIQY
ncbi:MAG: glycoside hydrolase family 26 protein [Bacteroidales bacterium]|nr:glycoside hydrolase family 26 protein [Bacteroidales bacterium]